MNILVELNSNTGNLNLAIEANLEDFIDSEFCITDLEERFHLPAGSVSGILSCICFHIIRLWKETQF